jgi:transcriptional regulator with GAF, ATPase, and Fis domain
MPETADKIISLSSRLAEMTEVDEVLKNLSMLLKKIIKSSWAAVYLLDSEQNDFAPAKSCGLPKKYHKMFMEMHLESGNIPLLKDVIHKKQTMQIPDAGDSSLLTPRFRDLLQGLTLLALPMVVRNQVMGAVFVARSREFPSFTSEEIDIIKSVVSQAAIVVSHIRLIDESLDMAVEMAKRIDIILTLDGINKAISSSLSHDKIIETAIQNIQRIIQCELVSVLGEVKGKLHVTATHGDPIHVR